LTVEEIQADYKAGLEELNTLSGAVTCHDSVTGIAGATVTLTTVEGAEINTTQTDSTGHYAFANVTPDYYDITATKRSYWSNTSNVTVTVEDPKTADISLCQKGDFNTNSEPADAGDLAKMADATVNTTLLDWTYDRDNNGVQADEDDLAILKDACVAV